ncbi:MAG TPA: hemerythrin domain-containing protein [Polyangiaceae bacterium]
MGVMIASGTDVVSFLKEQHQQVKDGFREVITAKGEARTKAFAQLRRLMAIHETAEEEIVHPVARRNLPDGNAIVDARLREEKEAKRLLGVLETLDVESAEFEERIHMLMKAIVEHAESEEREEFARLASMLDQSKLERMRRAVKFAESIAPTRPHSGMESATINALGGPFVAMIDRARDAITGMKTKH